MQVTIDKISTEKELLILTLIGEAVNGVGAGELSTKLTQAIQVGAVNVVINLGELTRIDDTGRGILLGSRNVIKEANGKLVLANVKEQILALLQEDELLKRFEIFDSVDKAVKSFK